MFAVCVATAVPPQVKALLGAGSHVSGVTKVAVTSTSDVIETTQVPVPEQPPPDQLANADPSATDGVAVRVTLPLPPANSAEHSAPQLMPVGADVTVPFPALLTVRACPAPQFPPALVPLPAVKLPLRHTQSPAPSRNQHPLAMPAAAIAVSHWSWHSVLVSWPRSLAATAPSVQLKAFETVVHPNAGAKVAVTAVAAVIETTQVPMPEQPPPVQPAKVDPSVAVGVAVSVTLVP